MAWMVATSGVYSSSNGSNRFLMREGWTQSIIVFILTAGCITLSVLDKWVHGGSGDIPQGLLALAGPAIGYFFRDASAHKDAQRAADTTIAVAKETTTQKVSDSMTITDAKKVETRHDPSAESRNK